jgi:hypothetical protein
VFFDNGELSIFAYLHSPLWYIAVLLLVRAVRGLSEADVHSISCLRTSLILVGYLVLVVAYCSAPHRTVGSHLLLFVDTVLCVVYSFGSAGIGLSCKRKTIPEARKTRSS